MVMFESFSQQLLPIRVGYLCICLVNFLLIKLLIKKFTSKNKKKFLQIVVLVFPLISFATMYPYFLIIVPKQYFTEVSIASFATFVILGFLLRQFKSALLVFHGTMALTLMLFVVLDKENINFHIILSVGNIATFASMMAYQKTFNDQIIEKYEVLKNFTYRGLAEAIVTSNERIEEIDKLFDPKYYFTVCLSSDWRGYQSLITRSSPEYISNGFKIYYEIVTKKLDEYIIKGNYYFDWWADECFIIFFSTTNDRKSLITESLNFADSLVGDYENINSKFDHNLKFDIGMSCGESYLGIFGPKEKRKITVISDVAGEAKRLESEAKNNRKLLGEGALPTIAISSKLHHISSNCNFQLISKFIKRESVEKDIVGEDVYFYSESFKKADIEIKRKLKIVA